MSHYRITASRKQPGDHEHQRIVGVCVVGTFFYKAAIYDLLAAGHKFSVHKPPAPDVDVIPRLENGNKYIQTHPDQFHTNNLLELPDC